MDKEIKQILELVQTINYKCDNLEKENRRLQNKNDRILKRIDDLERDISNVPQSEKNIIDNQILKIQDILNEYPISKSVIYRYFQNHKDNGLNVIQKDEGGTYKIKRADWEFWFNNMLSVPTEIFEMDTQILDILNQEEIDPNTQITNLKELIDKKSKLSNKITLKNKEFEFNL